MTMVIDLNLVCLVCLQDAVELHSIFDHDEQTPELSIAEKIALCSDLQAPDTEESKLPDKICLQCLSDLAAVWRFQDHCKAAMAVFNTIHDDDAEAMTLDNIDQNTKVEQDWKQEEVSDDDNYILSTTSPDEGGENEAQEVETLNEDELDSMLEEEEEEEQHEDEAAFEALQEDDVTEENYSEDDCETVKEEYPEPGEVDLTNTPNLLKMQTYGRVRHRMKYRTHTEDEGRAIESEEQENDRLTGGSLKNGSLNANERKAATKQRSNTTTKGGARNVSKSPVRKSKTNSPSTKPPKICDICGNTYKYQHALNAHMRRHTNTRPFPCEFCEKAFVSHVELRRHIRVHTGQKPYACQYCDRRFSDFGSRGKHERSHTGERPYVCSCGKSFAYPHVLSVHLLTHTGEKKFQCTECSKGFTKKVYLQAHMMQHVRAASNGNQATATTTRSTKRSHNSGEIMDIKTVAMEECIFTTECIMSDLEEVDAGDCKEDGQF